MASRHLCWSCSALLDMSLFVYGGYCVLAVRRVQRLSVGATSACVQDRSWKSILPLGVVAATIKQDAQCDWKAVPSVTGSLGTAAELIKACPRSKILRFECNVSFHTCPWICSAVSIFRISYSVTFIYEIYI